MLTQKTSSVISDLNILPRSVTKVGDVFVAHSSCAAYVWHKGEIIEVRPGDRLRTESISADDVARISEKKFAGTRDDKSIFMSLSGAISLDINVESLSLNAFDLKSAFSSALAYAKSLDSVHSAFEVCSESAAPKYLKYVGKALAVEDASDEYDLELEKGDVIKLVYLTKDRYELRLKESPRIQFIVRGHEVAQNIMGSLEFTSPFGQVSDQKTDKFEYVGTTKKKVGNIAKGTSVLKKRGKHYLPYNLAVALESWIGSDELNTLLSSLKVEADAPSYVKGKAIHIAPPAPKVAPVGQAQKLPKMPNATKVTGSGSPKDIKTVYGAYFPVSAANQTRSRIVFADTPALLAKQVNSIMGSYGSPVDYTNFSTLSTDENYKKASKNKVVIKATPLLKATYPGTTVKMTTQTEKTVFVEPRSGAPEITFPVYAGQETKLIDFFRRQIEEGYFNTGLRLAHPQPENAIRFSAAQMDSETYDQVYGVMRRIMAFLLDNGVELKKGGVSTARGSRSAEIRFKLPELTAEQKASVEGLQKDMPTFNAPIYETIKPKQPTVEILSANIHTGKVKARAQRGPELYGAPFDVLWSNVRRKNFN